MPWHLIVCAVLLAAAVALRVKLALVRRALNALCNDLNERLGMDTNTLITTSSGDPCVRRLAASLNGHLRILRDERRRLRSGNLELKDAVTNISHDLRTPLTAICGYLDLLEGVELCPEARRYLNIIESRAESMKALTEELFRYSVINSTAQDLPREDVNLCAALEEALAEHCAGLQAAGIEPEIEMPDVPVVRQLNRGALARILGNILSNAAKYSDGDLRIELTARGELYFSNAASALDEVQVGRLFERFYTVESARKSTGLGLSIARMLTEEMGGEIRAEYRGGRLELKLRFPGGAEDEGGAMGT